jgi:hypothetical protein
MGNRERITGFSLRYHARYGGQSVRHRGKNMETIVELVQCFCLYVFGIPVGQEVSTWDGGRHVKKYIGNVVVYDRETRE